MNRRAFARLSAAAALALPAVACGSGKAAAKAAAAEADSPLTPAEMTVYRQSLPQAARGAKRLRAVTIAYDVEPDFIFRAVPPRAAAAKNGGRS